MNKNLDSIKTLVIIVLVIIAGYFVYKNYSDRQALQSGMIYVRTCTIHTNHGDFQGTQVYNDVTGIATTCAGKALSKPTPLNNATQ